MLSQIRDEFARLVLEGRTLTYIKERLGLTEDDISLIREMIEVLRKKKAE